MTCPVCGHLLIHHLVDEPNPVELMCPTEEAA